jgi:hypothetical protein
MLGACASEICGGAQANAGKERTNTKAIEESNLTGFFQLSAK